MLLTVLEILGFMVAAAILGVLLGWVLRGTFSHEQAELSDLRAQLRKLKRQQRENDTAVKAEKVATPTVTSTPVAEKAEKAAAPSKNQKSSAKKKVVKKKTADKKTKVAKKKAVTKMTATDKKKAQSAAKKEVAGIIDRIGKGESKDDLTKIYGIGPKFAAMLRRMGITSYAQIAKLKKAEVRTISSALGVFSDRIERDDWVGGARKVLKAQK